MFMDKFIAKRIGNFIKKERENQNLSLRALAADCYISHTMLADIEKGKISPPNDILNLIYKGLEIDETLIEQINKSEGIKQMFNIFFDYVYNQDNEKANKIFQDLIKVEDLISNNLFYIDFCLIKLIYYTVYNKNSKMRSELITILDKNIENLTAEELVLFNIYKSQFLIDRNNLKEAELLLKDAENLTQDDRYHSLIYDSLGIVYTLNDKIALSITYFIKAKGIFDLKLNYVRSLYACTNISVAYIYSKAYEDAIKSCQECISIAERLNLHKVIMINAYNLSYIYLVTKQYEKVNYFVNLSLKHGNPDNGIYWHNAYSFYKLNEFKSSSYWIEEGRSKLLSSEKMMSQLYDYLEYRINNDLNSSIKILELLLEEKQYDSSFNNQDRKFILKEILELGFITSNNQIITKFGQELVDS